MLSLLGSEIEGIVREIASTNHDASMESRIPLDDAYTVMVTQVTRYRDIMRQARVAGRLSDSQLSLCQRQIQNWNSITDVLMSHSRRMLASTPLPLPEPEEVDEAPLPLPDIATVSPKVLAKYLKGLFELADTDGNGSLDLDEMHSLLTHSGLNFPPEAIKHILVDADTDHNGMVDYEEFVPMMISIIGYHNQLKAAEEEGPILNLPDLKSVSAPVLERYMKGLFEIGDSDENGVLDPQEVAVLLVKSGLDFSWQVIREIVDTAAP